MKKSKFKLDDLKVNSFVTEVPKDTQDTAQGGAIIRQRTLLCVFESKIFACNIQDPLYTWYAECPATAGNTAC